MILRRQLEHNKSLVMYKVLNNEAPDNISKLYTHPPSRYSNSRNYHLSLPRPRIDTSIAFSGAFLWNILLLTVIYCHSAHACENCVYTLKLLHMMDCDRKLLERERERGWGLGVGCHCSDWSFET